ncbi:MAG: glycosyltransferase family 9 protein, partial [Alphaproteobacteria bacterium]|nr:glycosyltransferase family 9 protein [Alphaproteobacteria bacterium]
MRPARVLVIKLGALGDMVQALGPMAAIRRHHRDAHLVLLTTAPFAPLARASGWFDEIWCDARPSLWNLPAALALARRLNAGRFARVYDLQTSDRSGFYFRLIGPPFGRRPEWSGIARGCSHPHANPGRDSMHTIERQAEQLTMAGVGEVPRVDL